MTKPIPPSAEALYLSRQNESATLRQHVIAWLTHLDAQGYSPRSTEGYRERLLPFVTWCEERGLLYAPQVSLEVLEVTSDTCAAGGKQTVSRWRWAGS